MEALNREAYLNVAASWLSSHFSAAGFPLPEKIRMTCGFPKGRGKAIGQCWSDANSADGNFELFVSPVIAETVEALAILTHELAHAAVGVAAGHKGPFVKCARAMLLEGKPTATVAGAAFKQLVAPFVREFGDYPHAVLSANVNAKKQTTRLQKCECTDCGYTVRVTAKWLDEAGAPLCPCNQEAMAIGGAGKE